MTHRFVVVVVLGLMVCALTADAVNLSGTTMVVPVIGRFAGAGGTQWRTDLFVSNHSTVPKTIVARLYLTGGGEEVRTFSLPAFRDFELRDVVQSVFGLSSGGGLLTLTTGGESEFDARARIYNVGNPAGEFGQNVPAVGLGHLRRQAFMYGLSGTNGNRLNAGVANPTPNSFSVQYLMRTGTGDVLASGSFPVGPFQVVQINDVFASWGVAPQSNVSLEFFTITNEELLYGYASEVRNDTGDAIFVFGQAPNA